MGSPEEPRRSRLDKQGIPALDGVTNGWID
jgi:hypothetical protein